MNGLYGLGIGLLLFLAGLRLMSSGLENLWSTSFAVFLKKYTGNRLSAFFLGLLFTAVTQSSSLATIIVVSIVDAGLLPLKAAIAVIIGANVGTTVTGQLLSYMLPDLGLPLIVAGLILLIIAKGKARSAGRALAGLGLLLTGMETFVTTLGPVSQSDWFRAFLGAASLHPFAGAAAGALATALIQSSSAVVGMTLSLAKTGVLDLSAGAAIVIGADIGTCADTLLAGLFSGKTARQAAFAHLFFNLVSATLIIPLYGLFIRVAQATDSALPRQLANAHSLYNLGGAIIFLIFLTWFQKMVENLVRADRTDKKRIFAGFSELIRRWF